MLQDQIQDVVAGLTDAGILSRYVLHQNWDDGVNDRRQAFAEKRHNVLHRRQRGDVHLAVWIRQPRGKLVKDLLLVKEQNMFDRKL